MSSVTTANRTSYDELPYPSYPLPQTHPDHLATLATLLGLDPPRPDRCRVLELGCASGGNLIPLALTLPESSFVGIDMSGEQIDAGRPLIHTLGLKNIDLRQMSILDVDESFGTFDYIICHGVYSWVPPTVQDKILEICQRLLDPRGVGYVSYNTHPGWHLRGVIRHMLAFHAGRFQDESPEQRVHRARSLLDFLARSAPTSDSAYSTLLREQGELLSRLSDAYLFHEHLEEHNEPVWFLDFCDRLTAHRLRYLAESEFGTMIPGVSFPPDVQHELEELAPNFLEKEQYMDFVRNRSFRQSLISHEHLRPSYELRADRLQKLFVASSVQPPALADLASDAQVEFTSPEGLGVESSTPLVKAALKCLGEAWPGAISFRELVSRARARLDSEQVAVAARNPGQDASDQLVLGQALLATFARAHGVLVRLSLQPPPRLATEVHARPVASPLARLQARQGLSITNLRHEVVPVSPFDRHLLPLADGTRDRTALLEGLIERFHQGVLGISQNDQSVHEAGRASEILGEVLDQQLPRLARASLLWA